RPARDIFHAWWSSNFLLSHLFLSDPHAAAASLVHLNSVPSIQMRCIITAKRRASATFVDLCLQHRPHVPCLNTDHRQACFGEGTEQPLRQRSSFQSNPLEVVGAVRQNRQQSIG